MKESASSQASPEASQLPLIRASELASYSFCHRAWWLSTVKNVSTRNRRSLARGQRVHASHERQVRVSIRWRTGGLLLITAGSLSFVIAALSGWWGG